MLVVTKFGVEKQYSSILRNERALKVIKWNVQLLFYIPNTVTTPIALPHPEMVSKLFIPQACLFHFPTKLYHLEDVALICPSDFYTLFYPSICRVLGLPADTTSHQTGQESSLGVKGNLIVPVLILPVYSVISSTRSLDIQTHPVVIFSLWSPEQITCWAETWSPPFLGTLNIYWAILASCLLFLGGWGTVPFPLLRSSPTLSLTFPCPVMIQWWLLTDDRHTHEKECIFMGRIFQNGRGIAPGGGEVGDIQISE